MKECRKITDICFRRLRSCIEAAMNEGKASDADGLMAELNACLRYHKSILALRASKQTKLMENEQLVNG